MNVSPRHTPYRYHKKVTAAVIIIIGTGKESESLVLITCT